MDREELDEIEEHENEIIRKFKKKELNPDEELVSPEVHEYLIEKFEKSDYVIQKPEEFKKYNVGTLYKIHDALKNDEPKILEEFNIKKKKDVQKYDI